MAARPISRRRLFWFRLSALFVSIFLAYVIAEIVFRVYRYNQLLHVAMQSVVVPTSAESDPILKMTWNLNEEFETKNFAEFFTRMHEASVYDPDIGFRLLPNFPFDVSPKWGARRKWKTNNHGHVADEDYPVEKPASEYRIITIGDSFTQGLNNGVRWQDMLQKRLNEHAGWKKFVKDKFTRVLNLGLSGIGIGQFKAVYDFEGKKFGPDLAILDFITDDIRRRWYSMGRSRTPADARDHIYKNILGRLHWYRIYPELLASTRLGKKLLRLEYHLDPQSSRYYESVDEAMNVSVGAIRHIAGQCSKVLVTHHPLLQDLKNGGFVTPQAKALLGELAAELGDTRIWFMADYLYPLKKDGESYESWYQHPFDGHHSDLGQQIFATAMENLLIEQFVGK